MQTPTYPAADPHPRKPKVRLPPGATDTHAHLFGPASEYPWSPQRGYTPPEALPAAYEHLHAILGVSRCVLTQPSVYGTDNRAMVSTLLNEKGWNGDVIERQHAHAEPNGACAVYNHTERLPERRRMMQAWSGNLGSDHGCGFAMQQVVSTNWVP